MPPDVRLVGVILREGQAPVALIETPRPQRQALYRVGDTVGEARLERILEDRAILSYRGEEVVLRLAGSPAAPAPTPAARPSGPASAAGPRDSEVTARLRELARRLRDNPGDAEASAEMRQLRAGQRPAPVRASDLAQGSAAPDVAAALPVEGGVRVVEVSEEGLLQRLGLRPGDIVRRVNRRPVGPERSLGEALGEAAAAGSERLQIDLTRDGVPARQEHRLEH
jgi:type II secretory pathway component PulC